MTNSLAPLQTANVTVHPAGLRFTSYLTYDEWMAAGQTLTWITYKWLPFAWGDWIIAGEQRWEGIYAQAIEVSGRAIRTLQNYAWVASHVPTPIRNLHDHLCWSHHRAIAFLADYPDKQRDLLALAAKNQRTVTQFEDDLSAMRGIVLGSNGHSPCGEPEDGAEGAICPYCGQALPDEMLDNH
jgi:hypothetical protein